MAAVHNGFFPRVQAEIRGCCNSLYEIARKVVVAVRDFIEMAIRFIFCMRRREPVHVQPPQPRPPQPIWHLPVVHFGDLDDPVLVDDPNLVDEPVNLENLRQALRNGIADPRISKQMTPRDFINLINEFPNERDQVGRWAVLWTNNRILRIDPQHPYFEIFQRAFEFKDQLGGGLGKSPDYRTYSINHEGYFGWGKPLFPYILYSLMGFQELSREDNRELMRKLDNQQPAFHANPAYKYARALSKMYAYPTRPDNGAYRMDINDKLQMGIGAPMEAYRAAVAHNKVLDYFQMGFNLRNCFDYRVSDFQQFTFQLDHPNIEDFSANIVGKDTTDHRILEYHRVFKNEQIFKFARARGLNYDQLKRDVDHGEDNANTQALQANYFTRDAFELYLQENHQPVREKLLHPIGQPIHIIPHQPDWRDGVPLSLKKVPIDLIPAGLRQVGTVLGVFDPSIYEVTVLRIRGQIAEVEFSDQKANRHFNRVINYQEPWRGTNYRKQIPLNWLPWHSRHIGAKVGVRDPSTHQVKVFAVDDAADTVTIDFRGEPVTRERWERALVANGII